jgi:extradiol dioxygenase family protein
VGNAFHLALPVSDLAKAKHFYSEILGVEEKRSSFNWIDYDFFGHQMSLHLVNENPKRPESTSIDGDQVPSMHFGMILEEDQWNSLRDKLAAAGVDFVIGPRIRFEGKEGEQGTFFVVDPSGNYLEFKYFSDTSKGTWY